MDTAMRDMELLEERNDPGPLRRASWLALAAFALTLVVFGVGILLGGGGEEELRRDPLLAIEQAARLEQTGSIATAATATEAAEEPDVTTIDRARLTFPDALLERDSRPEVEAALAAATAEFEALAAEPGATIPAAEAMPADAFPEVPPPPAIEPPRALPAVAVASSVQDELEQRVPSDPMVAAAIPPASDAPSSASMVGSGHDGLYTLQVSSYPSPAEADELAAALRARGHHAFVMRANVPERGLHYRVRIGPFENMRDASQYRASFEASEQMNTYIVRRRDEE